jgi:hypothetical protein
VCGGAGCRHGAQENQSLEQVQRAVALAEERAAAAVAAAAEDGGRGGALPGAERRRGAAGMEALQAELDAARQQMVKLEAGLGRERARGKELGAGAPLN